MSVLQKYKFKPLKPPCCQGKNTLLNRYQNRCAFLEHSMAFEQVVTVTAELTSSRNLYGAATTTDTALTSLSALPPSYVLASLSSMTLRWLCLPSGLRRRVRMPADPFPSPVTNTPRSDTKGRRLDESEQKHACRRVRTVVVLAVKGRLGRAIRKVRLLGTPEAVRDGEVTAAAVVVGGLGQLALQRRYSIVATC